MTYPTNGTVLVISPLGVPPYSARGLQQTLQPIDASKQMRRTVNGTLTDLSASAFRKYNSTISCTDQQTPAIDGVWPGQTVVVDCVAELCYATSSGGQDREIVEGSEYTASGFTFYRPRLTMKVTDFQLTRDEYGTTTGWQLSLEEV